MKKRLPALLLSIVLGLGLMATAFAAGGQKTLVTVQDANGNFLQAVEVVLDENGNLSEADKIAAMKAFSGQEIKVVYNGRDLLTTTVTPPPSSAPVESTPVESTAPVVSDNPGVSQNPDPNESQTPDPITSSQPYPSSNIGGGWGDSIVIPTGKPSTPNTPAPSTQPSAQPSAEPSPEPSQPPVTTNPFVDVAKGEYYYDAVLWAVEKGITDGTSPTTFSPNTFCNRAQTVTFLWRAAGSPVVTGSNPFTDVKPTDYYYNAVLWAVAQGITNGTTTTTFSPSETVNRAQTVTFMYRAAKAQAVSGSNSFTDVAAGEYYANAVQWAVSKGITNGTSTTTFSPAQGCTRGQIVTFLYRGQ